MTLADILRTIQSAGYHYDLAKGGAHVNPLFPPPAGTKLNCRSAAWLFLRHAKQAGIGDGLQALYYSAPKGGYLIMDLGMYRALSDPPQIQGGAFGGWEFENHYRVKDTKTGIVYDPTFCTASNLGRGNPVGVLATAEQTDAKTFRMTTVYGTRYEVARQGVQVACRELHHHLVPNAYLVSDASFKPTILQV